MAYQLGVDLGTSFTVAAVLEHGRARVASLGSRGAAMPSVLFMREDGTFLAGDAADRRGFADPSRVAREFKRRLGDPTPLLLGGTPHSAHALMAKLLSHVLDVVSAAEGAPPDHVVVCHPANWGPYKRELLDQAIHMTGCSSVTTLTEPEAAAIHYAATERLEPGEIVAVYDLGGGTFDAAVLAKSRSGFDLLGEPEGLERLGGIDFDDAVFGYVDSLLSGGVSGVNPEDRDVVQAVARLRQDCVDAKEALSADTDVQIPVWLPAHRTEVRLTRSELETMIRPTLTDTVVSLQRAVAGAGVNPSDLKAVLLVGGSSRIPLVGQLVSSALGRPVAIDVHPKHAIALGASLAAGSQSGHEVAVDRQSPPPSKDAVGPADVAEGLEVGVRPRGHRERLARAGQISLIAIPLFALAAAVGWSLGGKTPKARVPVPPGKTGDIIEFLLPRPGQTPSGIVSGPQRRIWFTEADGDRIGSFSTTGALHEVVVPTPGAIPSGIAAGPDGSIWFTEFGGNKIGQLTPAGVVHEFAIPTPSSGADAIVLGPDGNFWFVENTTSKLGRLAPSGAIVEVGLPASLAGPVSIRTGVNQDLWFTGSTGDTIGRVAVDGTVTSFPLPAHGRRPLGIAIARDGTVWFTEGDAGMIGHLSPSTGQVTEFPLSTPKAAPFGIVAGPDGNMWFVENTGNAVGRITPSGAITEFSVPSASSGLSGITVGPDGNIWFTEVLGNRVGRLLLAR